MRLGVVGWGADSGVGRELIDAVRHLPVSCAFVMANAAKKTRADLLSEVPTLFANPLDLESSMQLFLDCHQPDVILTWEVPGHWAFPERWRKRNIKWVHVVHWDWFSSNPDHLRLWRQAQLIAPNRMCQRLLKEHYGLHSVLLPVPVDVEKLEFVERKTVDLFISVYGYGGTNDRRSLPEIFAAWRALRPAPPLLIRAQKEPDELKKCQQPEGVQIKIGNTQEPGGLYEEGQIALQPSRYEGVGLSMLEAQACGVPVIAVDAPPMNEIAPDLLVPMEKRTSLYLMGKNLDSHVPSVKGIQEVVRRVYETDISALSRTVRARVERHFSWGALRKQWIKVLSS